MREINRSRYLRGTKTWPIRNLFVFGTLAVTLLSGTALVFMFPGFSDTLERKSSEDREQKLAKREKIRAIELRRQELGLEGNRNSDEDR